LSKKKLAEKARISANMINDIDNATVSEQIKLMSDTPERPLSFHAKLSNFHNQSLAMKGK
jgi:ribosome-binding protein aMBF1 (putative translation factor)